MSEILEKGNALIGSLREFIGAVDRANAANQGPTTPPPPPPPNEDPHVPPPQPSGPYRVVHRGSGVPGADELPKQGFVAGDQVYKAINSEQGGRGGGQVSWFVKQPADNKPIPSEFTLAFTL